MVAGNVKFVTAYTTLALGDTSVLVHVNNEPYPPPSPVRRLPKYVRPLQTSTSPVAVQ